jgi:hypothetical protein
MLGTHAYKRRHYALFLKFGKDLLISGTFYIKKMSRM